MEENLRRWKSGGMIYGVCENAMPQGCHIDVKNIRGT